MSATGAPGVRMKTRKPTAANDASLLFLIFISPIAASPLMQMRFIEAPGAKLVNLVALAFVISFLYGRSKLLRTADRIERNALIVFAALMCVFVVAFLRSLPNVGTFHEMAQDAFPASPVEYALSRLGVPLVFAAMFVFILKYMCTPAAMSRLLETIGVAMFVLSAVIIGAVLVEPAALFDPSRVAIARLMTNVVGMHYNDVGTFYSIAAPILLYLALKRGAFRTLNYFVALVAVTVLESRTALLVFVAMSVATLFVLGRARTLLAALPPVALIAAIALGPVLINLLSVGESAHSAISLDKLLAGREERIWIPLALEWWSDPGRFWFGAGEYGILSSYMLHVGVTLAVGVAHNAYFEYFLDNGFILASCLLVGIAAFLHWSIRVGLTIRSQLYWVLLLSVAAFLIASFTGRRFYPENENVFLMPVMAMLINMARLKLPGSSGITAARTVAPARQAVGANS
jgi:O-antigen ligase/polysaccharide polymerase Wzy-like membrane protein